jgi:hypothetical protein
LSTNFEIVRFASDTHITIPAYVRLGSWSCENAVAQALTRGDDGEVSVFVHFAEFGEFSIWKCF